MEQKTASRGCGSEKESHCPGKRTLGESDGEERRWVRCKSENKKIKKTQQRIDSKEIIWRRRWRKAHVLHILDIDEELLEERIRRKVLSELKRSTYHWTPQK